MKESAQEKEAKHMNDTLVSCYFFWSIRCTNPNVFDQIKHRELLERVFAYKNTRNSDSSPHYNNSMNFVSFTHSNAEYHILVEVQMRDGQC